MFLKNQVKAHLMEKHAGVLEELGEGPDMLFCTITQGESSKGIPPPHLPNVSKR